MKIEFAHRSADGVSIGVIVDNNIASLSMAFTNLHAGDQFCKKTARRIIKSRLYHKVSPRGKHSPIVADAKACDGVTSRDIVIKMRQALVTDPYFFAEKYELQDVPDLPADTVIYYDISRREAKIKLEKLFFDAVEECNIESASS